MSLPEPPDPYVFVRAVTLSLAGLWSLTGLVRIFRFGRRWERRLVILGVSRGWLRRQVSIVVLRATIFDPLNVAMICVLIMIWTLPR